MAEDGFPGQHTTTTTITSNTTIQTHIFFDPSYLRTPPGMLKAAQVVLNLLGFICIQASSFSYIGKGQYFSWISMTGFWFTGILLGLYLFHFIEKFYKIPWLQIELGFCALWAFFYLIAASLAISVPSGAYKAAAVFGFCAMIAYGADGVLKWLAVRAGGLAQGTRVVSKQTTSVSTVSEPRY